MMQVMSGRRRLIAAFSIFVTLLTFCLEPISASWCAEQPGSLVEADQAFQRAMQIWGDGPSHEAELLLSRALTIREALLGPDDPKVIEVIERLGALSYNRSEYVEAEERFRKALGIALKLFGERNIDTAYLMGDLGARYVSKNDAMKLKPSLSVHWTSIGSCYHRTRPCGQDD